MSEFQGMQWFKTDFQVQTPEDNKHWADDDLRLLSPRRPIVDGEPCEIDIQSKARLFLTRCHELELQIVGITDHNFSEKSESRDWFLTHLVEQNRSVARHLNRPPICLLPGFEVDIGYHMLCLFEPATKVSHLRRVNMILVKLGLAENQRFRNGVPQPLRYNDTNVSLKRLLEIVQKEHAGLVIAAHSDQKDGILSESRNIKDYQLPSLLAVEVTSNPLIKKYKDILSGRDREWSRPLQQPAYVMSSDAKSLKVDEVGAPLANSLGYRFTWVKASSPSVKSLKQAFLDGESRVSLGVDRPSDAQTHPRIVFLQCKGLRFLSDQIVYFSPNLNTVIGGRGTGKSTLLELLRFAFGRQNEESISITTDAKIKRIKSTFTDDTVINVGWEAVPGQVDIISLSVKDGHFLTAGTVTDFSTYLRHIPVQFFSQQQLSDLTSPSGGNNLLAMIDDACGAELQVLKGQELTLQTEIRKLYASQDQLMAIKAEITNLTQEVSELDRQWQARKDVQQEALQHQRAQAARRYRTQLDTEIKEDIAAMKALSLSLSERKVSGLQVETWPEPGWFNELSENVLRVRRELGEKVNALIDEFEIQQKVLFEADASWSAIDRELNDVQQRFLTACTDRGLQPQDVARLQEIDRVRQTKQSDLLVKNRKKEELESSVRDLLEAMDKLRSIWAEQFLLRKKTSMDIGEKAGVTIRIYVSRMADSQSFLPAWEVLAPDGRSKIGRHWSYLGERLFQEFLDVCKSRESSGESVSLSPWDYVAELLNNKSTSDSLEILPFIPDLREHLLSIRQGWREQRLARVSDLVDIGLYRADETLVGRVSDNKLSEGQRNTAVLNLLLARGTGPIVIDQPEDELDSSFIYQDLVPLLRKVKYKRQLILATHNANLPVNADAEFIYALEAREGRGEMLAQGGLDRNDTTTAILDVMEGSKEAFRRRQEKYHF